MNNEQRTIRGFTLIELLVAIAILAIVLSFAGVIFRVSVDSQRTALANAEIMQKLRAITDQLNSDLKGLQTDAPLLIWFRQDPKDPNQRYDQIMFFADGYFQSTQLYDGNPPAVPLVPAPTGRPIIGNVARVYYGQAQSLDSRSNIMKYPFYLDRQKRLLARRQHILTADPDLYVWPSASDVSGTFDDVDGAPKGYNNNEIFEHDSLLLARWKTLDITAYDTSGGTDTLLNFCFDFPPWVNIGDAKTFHKLMCEGVGRFTIQWAYWDPGLDPINPLDDKLMWFPSDNPDGSGTYSHFDLVRMDGFPSKPPVTPKPGYTDFDVFGVFFNIPNGTQRNYWGIASLMRYNPTNKFPSGFYPKALKFTFTLYDSKGVIKNGRTFTHIVYLD
jgi:prepilin-type N-terminal cleavage/methylation domain-containing protein